MILLYSLAILAQSLVLFGPFSSVVIKKCISNLQANYNLPYLMTSKLNQCSLESYFSELRGQGGSNNDPTALNLTFRISRNLTCKLLQEEGCDLFKMETQLKEYIQDYKANVTHSTDISLSDNEIPANFDPASDEGFHWIAGLCLAKKLIKF